MTKVCEVYKCEVCGNIVELVHDGADALVCCGEVMRLKVENSVDAAKEKHVPVVEISGNRIFVKVGEIMHPMEDKHFIEWVEVITEKRVYRANFAPGDAPEARFVLIDGENVVKVREYCNLHGLWVK